MRGKKRKRNKKKDSSDRSGERGCAEERGEKDRYQMDDVGDWGEMKRIGAKKKREITAKTRNMRLA